MVQFSKDWVIAIEIRTFLFGFQIVLEKMVTIFKAFRSHQNGHYIYGFQIPFEIRTICTPTSI